MRDAAQPGGPSRVEVRLELRSGYADLGTAEPEADQGVDPVVEGEVEGGVRSRHPRLTRDVVDPPEHQPEVTFRRHPGVLDRLGVGLDRDPDGNRGERRTGQLGVPDLLPLGHLARDLVGEQPDVLFRPDQVDHGEVDLDEVGEVAELVELAQLLGVAGHDTRVPGGELGDDAGGGRADVVHVQLGLGQSGDEGGEADPGQSVSARTRSTNRRPAPPPPRTVGWRA